MTVTPGNGRSIVLAAMLLSGTVLSACSGLVATPTQAPSPADGPTNAPALSGSLSLLHTFSAGAPGVARGTPAALGMALNLVRAENPSLQLNVTEVSLGDLFISYQLQASGGIPDVIFAPNDNLGGLARAGIAADLSVAMITSDRARFSQLALDGSTVAGKLVQVPSSLRAVAFYYDSSAVPSFPATTDDLLAAVRNGEFRLGLFEGIYQVFGFWGAFGGRLLDDSGRCVADTTGVADAFAFYAQLADAGATWYGGADGYSEMTADFNEGALDAIIDGPWAVDGYRDARPDSLGVAPLPAGPGGPALPMVGVDGWVINPHGANVDLAIDFALRMAQPDILGLLADQGLQVPADPSVQPTDPLAAQFTFASQHGTARPQAVQLGAFWGRFTTALSEVVEDGRDPAQAVGDACAAMNADNGL